MVDDVLADGRRFYRPRRGEAFIPVEFQGARLPLRPQHGAARPTAPTWPGTTASPFFGFDLRPVPGRAGRPGRPARRLRARRGASSAGRRSSTSATARSSRTSGSTRRSRRRSSTCRSARSRATTPPTALPQRTLLRHLTWELPSGQAIARAIGRRRARARRPRASCAATALGLERSTPLWYYVLQGGRAGRGRPAPRAGRRADRRRGDDRPAAERSPGPARAAGLAARRCRVGPASGWRTFWRSRGSTRRAAAERAPTGALSPYAPSIRCRRTSVPPSFCLR